MKENSESRAKLVEARRMAAAQKSERLEDQRSARTQAESQAGEALQMQMLRPLQALQQFLPVIPSANAVASIEQAVALDAHPASLTEYAVRLASHTTSLRSDIRERPIEKEATSRIIVPMPLRGHLASQSQPCNGSRAAASTATTMCFVEAACSMDDERQERKEVQEAQVGAAVCRNAKVQKDVPVFKDEEQDQSEGCQKEAEKAKEREEEGEEEEGEEEDEDGEGEEDVACDGCGGCDHMAELDLGIWNVCSQPTPQLSCEAAISPEEGAVYMQLELRDGTGAEYSGAPLKQVDNNIKTRLGQALGLDSNAKEPEESYESDSPSVRRGVRRCRQEHRSGRQRHKRQRIAGAVGDGGGVRVRSPLSLKRQVSKEEEKGEYGGGAEAREEETREEAKEQPLRQVIPLRSRMATGSRKAYSSDQRPERPPASRDLYISARSRMMPTRVRSNTKAPVAVETPPRGYGSDLTAHTTERYAPVLTCSDATSEDNEAGFYTKRVQSYTHDTGVGFIECVQPFVPHSRDVFLHKAQIRTLNLKINQRDTSSAKVDKTQMPQAKEVKPIGSPSVAPHVCSPLAQRPGFPGCVPHGPSRPPLTQGLFHPRPTQCPSFQRDMATASGLTLGQDIRIARARTASKLDPAKSRAALARFQCFVRMVDVTTLRGTHDSIKTRFANGIHRGQSVEEFLCKLVDGCVQIYEVTPLVAVLHHLRGYVVFGNRRFAAFSRYKEQIGGTVLVPCIVHDLDRPQETGLTPGEVLALFAKFVDAATTRNGGVQTRWRGN